RLQASGPSLGRKRPRRAAVGDANRVPHCNNVHRTAPKSRGPSSLLITISVKCPCGNTATPTPHVPLGKGGSAICRAQNSSLGQAPHGASQMTAIDFAAFVDQLATASGEAILPFFRTSLGIENKVGPGTFDPVTAADRA